MATEKFRFTGTEPAEHMARKLNWLTGMVADSQGPQGDKGDQGIQGEAGIDGVEGVESTKQAWEAEAWKLTAGSYSTEAEDVFVKLYTSNDDGTFTVTNTADYSVVHWNAKTEALKDVAGGYATDSANSATEASDAVIGIDASVAQASGYADNSQASADLALANSEAVNFIAGMIVQWHSDRKPTGWLWCDGQEFTVFSPNPSSAYNELYQALVDPTYVMTEKPEDWDANYPEDPNGWYDPSNPNSVVTQAELDLTVTVPDYRGTFLRAKDQAGTILPARGIDTNGVVDLSTITWSQNKEHDHDYLGIYHADGMAGGNGNASFFTTRTTEVEGGAEAHPTYQTTNYIIRTKGVYNGTGSGSGGSSITPVAQEIEYVDTHGTGYSNLQDTTDFTMEQTLFGGTRRETNGTLPASIALVASLTSLNDRAPSCRIHEDYSLTMETSSNGGGRLVNLITGSYTTANVVADVGNMQYNPFNDTVSVTYGLTSIVRVYDVSNPLAITLLKEQQLVSGASSHYCVNAIYIGDDKYVYVIQAQQTSTYGRIKYVADATVDATGVTVISATGTTQAQGICIGSRADQVMILNDDGLLRVFDTTTEVLNPVLLTMAGIYLGSYTGLQVTMSMDSDDSLFVRVSNYSSTFKRMQIDFDTLENSVALSDKVYDTGFVYDYVVSFNANQDRFGGSIVSARSGGENRFSKIVDDPNAKKYQYYNAEYGHASGVGVGGYNLASDWYDTTAKADGAFSMTLGVSTQTANEAELAIGKWNLSPADTILNIGIGIADGTRANGLEVYTTGDVQAPNRLDVPTDKSLVTADNYGASTVGGTAKFRLDGTILYITTDGTDA